MSKFEPAKYSFKKEINGDNIRFVIMDAEIKSKQIVTKIKALNEAKNKEDTLLFDLQGIVLHTSKGWGYGISNEEFLDTFYDDNSKSKIINTSKAKSLFNNFPQKHELMRKNVENTAIIETKQDLIEFLLETKFAHEENPHRIIQRIDTMAENLISRWGEDTTVYEEITNSKFEVTYELGEVLPPWKSSKEDEIITNDKLLEIIDLYKEGKIS